MKSSFYDALVKAATCCSKSGINLTRSAILSSLLLLFSVTALAETTPLKIGVAANFSAAMNQLVPLFEQQTGAKVTVTVGASGRLYAQIEHGAPYHIFMSADTDKPQRLIKSGAATAEHSFIYALGQLVLWAPGQQAVNADYLTQARSIAVANPRHAPYGAAAKQALKTLYPIPNSHKLALRRGQNIAQTYQFVASGHVDAGFVALSQVLKHQVPSNEYWLVPSSLHTAIAQQAVITETGQKHPHSVAWMQFLASPKVQQLLQTWGYKSQATNLVQATNGA